MTAPAPAHRRTGVRRRMIAAFLGLAVVPFAAALSILFFVARYDVVEVRAGALARQAGMLAELLTSRITSLTQAVTGVAGVPEVRTHVTRNRNLPPGWASTVRRLLPEVRRVWVDPAEPGRDVPGLRVSDTLLRIRVPVFTLQGEPAATLVVEAGLDRLQRDVEWFHVGENGVAVWVGRDGERLAGGKGAPVPPTPLGKGWTRFESGGQAYVAGAAPVQAGAPEDFGWSVAVVQPVSDLLAPFYRVVGQLALLLVILAAAVVALAWRMADTFVRPLLRIRDGAEIVSRVNLGHRIEIDTGDELQDLAEAFNRMAESLSRSYRELETRVADTTRVLQEERNRLATVLRTMREGVVLANVAGEVVLMNPRARSVLEHGPESPIGAPLSRLLPEDRTAFYVRRVRRRWDQGREAQEEVVFPLEPGALLRGTLAGVPGPGGELAGFLLVYREAHLSPEEHRADETLMQMPALLKGPVATSRALLEALGRHPGMKPAQRDRFLQALAEEASRMAERIRAAEEAATLLAGARWEMVPADPRNLLEEAVALVPGAYVNLRDSDDAVPRVLVEPFLWVASLAAALRWLGERTTGWAPVDASLEVSDEAVLTVLRIASGGPLSSEDLERVEVAAKGEPPLPLGDAVRRNRGELWIRGGEKGGQEVCFGLERATRRLEEEPRPGILDDQPEFYDFDLFLPRPAVEGPELLDTALRDLEAVVLDTETTGLEPSKGDRIISLSAVKIRAGKVLAGSQFHTLVNPGRPVPAASSEFHGLRDEDVADAPSLAEVLPKFHAFVANAVLVAHNAAFDKKFLDMGAREAGLPLLENPVLDTLFLSYGVHKDLEGHNLDAIAERLGVTIEGRHTSLGDARATAEIFLRLIPLLEARGIRTLGEAKAFCDRMLLLRWQSSRF